MRTIILLFCIIFLIFMAVNYPKWSYKRWSKRCDINAKHPDWKPWCGRDFIKEDPQWFINHGYEEWINKERR